MAGLAQRGMVLRAMAGGLFVMAALGLLGATLLREPLASQSPAVRSRTILAQTLAGDKDFARYEAVARRLAVRDPLQAASFVLLGTARIGRDNGAFDAVHPLMQAAMERQPSLEAPQIWLAADYARRGDYGRSLALFDKVLTLSGDYSELLMPALSELLRQPASRDAVLARLHQYPVWRSALLGKVIEGRALPDDAILALLAGPVPPAKAESVAAERMAFVAALVARGELERAHGLYRSYVGISPRAPVYDGNFAAEHPFVPFGWAVTAQPADYAERVARPSGRWALRIHASGARDITMLEQTLALSPGRWTVRITARDSGLAKPQGLQLVIECLAGGSAALAARPLGDLGSADGVVQVSFVVTPGCALQRLAIKAAENDDAASEIEVTGFAASSL